jgi:hypothetical protein
VPLGRGDAHGRAESPAAGFGDEHQDLDPAGCHGKGQSRQGHSPGVIGGKLRLARRTTIAHMPATIAQSVIRWTT